VTSTLLRISSPAVSPAFRPPLRSMFPKVFTLTASSISIVLSSFLLTASSFSVLDGSLKTVIMGNANSRAERSSLEEGTASIITSSRKAINDNGSQMICGTSSDIADIERISEGITNLEMAKAYTPPTSPVKPLVHYIFLVHGWLGNDLEMSYLAESFQRSIARRSDVANSGIADEEPDVKRLRRSNSEGQQRVDLQNIVPKAEDMEMEKIDKKPEIIVHSVKCNVGKTHDGIRKGGWRLANEITEFIRTDVRKRCSSYNTLQQGKNDSEDEAANETINSKHATFSLVGNSLGGLYSRYAISLIPYQVQISVQNSSPSTQINLHPNIFCTTATPHLGVSRHTYLPIPRFAESIIGTGLGETGRDLFRLNSDTNLVGAVGGAVGGGIRRLRSFRRNAVDENNNNSEKYGSECEQECIIRNMCLDERYLYPLRNFRQRVAYANAYGTDFQVPTQTAAFLCEDSDVCHTLITHRDRKEIHIESEKSRNNGEQNELENDRSFIEDSGNGECPSFVVAILRTDQQPWSSPSSSGSDSPSSELLKMSQALDALGWKKVFIDVRNRIPVPGITMPAWLRSSWRCLDDLIKDLTHRPYRSEDQNIGENGGTSMDTRNEGECVLTSKDLARSTTIAETLHFPLGHTVMVANSKSETYSKLNSQGRPVMDKLSEDMIREVLMFE